MCVYSGTQFHVRKSCRLYSVLCTAPIQVAQTDRNCVFDLCTCLSPVLCHISRRHGLPLCHLDACGVLAWRGVIVWHGFQFGSLLLAVYKDTKVRCRYTNYTACTMHKDIACSVGCDVIGCHSNNPLGPQKWLCPVLLPLQSLFNADPTSRP